MRISPRSWLASRRHKRFRFDRPLLLIHSDDWGRVGVRDHEGWEQLCVAGISLGRNPYDFYCLETAEDVGALHEVLACHRDSVGRPPSVVMNFVTANLDFAGMAECNFRQLLFQPLYLGLPGTWNRPGLLEAYRSGVAARVFHPALHGTSHFCQAAVNRELTVNKGRANLLRTLWQAQTPYIFHLMPWIGYEYWDPECPSRQRQLDASRQSALVREGCENFLQLFGCCPISACAPGYRANRQTRKAWCAAGIKVAQNGPGRLRLPCFSEEVLNVYRNVNFEPATDEHFSVANALQTAATCFAHGLPAIVSMHSINLHSRLTNYRRRTLAFLDQFLTALEAAYPDLLYVNDADLYEIVIHGHCDGPSGRVVVNSRFAVEARA